MNERHKGDLIRASAEPAPARFEKIQNMVADPNMYAADDFKNFGFEVDTKPMEAIGTVLEAPKMLDGNNAEIKVDLSISSLYYWLTTTKNQDGTWRTRKFYKPARELKWISVFIENDRVRCDRRQFEGDFIKHFKAVGQQVLRPFLKPEKTVVFSLVFQLKAQCCKNQSQMAKNSRKWRMLWESREKISPTSTLSLFAAGQMGIKRSAIMNGSSYLLNEMLAFTLSLSGA